MRALLLAIAALLLPVPVLAQQAVPTGKLPAGAVPLAYRLDMTIVPEKDRFNGHAEIDVQLSKPAASIYMHGRDLHVTRAVAKIGAKEMPVTFTQVTDLGLARLDFPFACCDRSAVERLDDAIAVAEPACGLPVLDSAAQSSVRLLGQVL